MALKADTTHVVVEFCGEIRNKQLLVDLVVRSWVFYSQSSARWICKYPQECDYIYLSKWVQECFPPKDDFPEFEVRIIKEAPSFEIAASYLHESYTTSEIKSIDGDVSDNLSDPGNPRIFSAKETANILAIAKKNIPKTSTSADQGSQSQVSVTVTQQAECSVSQQRDKEIVSSPSTKSAAREKTATAVVVDDQCLIGSDGNLADSTTTDSSSASLEDDYGVLRSVKHTGAGAKTKTTEPRTSAESINTLENSASSGDERDMFGNVEHEGTKAKTKTTAPQTSAESFNTLENSGSSGDERDMFRHVEHRGARANTKTTDTETRTSAESIDTLGSTTSLEEEQDMPRNVKNTDTRGKIKTAKSHTGAATTKATKKNVSSIQEAPSRRRHRSPPIVATLKDLTDMEARIEKKISASKRSVLYNMTKIYRVVKSNAVARNGQAEDEPAPLENVLGMKFPLERFEHFETLEAKLEDPDAKAAMKTYMKLFSCGSTPQEDIANILPEIIKRSIQLLYSGAGKVQKGIAKLNFSATLTYSCMEEILIKKYVNKLKPKQIRSHTGTWLSRAGDREGGKAERDAKTAAEKAEREAAIKAANDAAAVEAVIAAEAAAQKAAREAAAQKATREAAAQKATREAAAQKAARDAATKAANHAKAVKAAKAAKAAKVAKAYKEGKGSQKI